MKKRGEREAQKFYARSTVIFLYILHLVPLILSEFTHLVGCGFGGCSAWQFFYLLVLFPVLIYVLPLIVINLQQKRDVRFGYLLILSLLADGWWLISNWSGFVTNFRYYESDLIISPFGWQVLVFVVVLCSHVFLLAKLFRYRLVPLEKRTLSGRSRDIPTIIGLILLVFIIFSIFIYALLPKTEKDCSTIKNSTQRDDCFVTLAGHTKPPELCAKIEQDDVKDSCFTSLAFSTQNQELCNKIKSALGRVACLEEVAVMVANPEICSMIASSDTRKECFQRVQQQQETNRYS